MNTCLHVTCGPYHLLFDIARVMEVGDVPATATHATHRHWREKNLPVIDLRARLGITVRGARQQLVVEDDAALTMVDVDSIVGIRDCGDEDRIELPPLHAELEQLIDGGWLDRASGTCLLHVRLPLAAGQPADTASGEPES
ncbi:MAG: chemotaxis protein CheW [Gammaproteobacteria bacterium]